MVSKVMEGRGAADRHPDHRTQRHPVVDNLPRFSDSACQVPTAMALLPPTAQAAGAMLLRRNRLTRRRGLYIHGNSTGPSSYHRMGQWATRGARAAPAALGDMTSSHRDRTTHSLRLDSRLRGGTRCLHQQRTRALALGNEAQHRAAGIGNTSRQGQAKDRTRLNHRVVRLVG